MWPWVKLGEVLCQVRREAAVDPLLEYDLLGARWYAKGLYVKETKLGSQIKASKLYQVHEGDFVYNRLFAWKGSFAVASNHDHGCWVSNEFPCFKVDKTKVEPKYLWYYFSRESAWDDALGLSYGATPTSRNRLNETHFISLEIPLPPLPEQRRIVAKVEMLAARIGEADVLRHQQHHELERLVVSMAHRFDLSDDDKISSGWLPVKFSDVLEQSINPVIVEPQLSYPNLGIFSFGRGLFYKEPIEGAKTSAKTLYRVKTGQFIYSRLFAFEGAYGRVTDNFDDHFVSNEFPVFHCNPSYVTSDFLWAYFRSPRIWIEIAAGSKGLGDRRQRVHPEQILNHHCLLPPLELQKKITRIQNTLERLEDTRKSASNEIDALLPSILDKAFKGQL